MFFNRPHAINLMTPELEKLAGKTEPTLHIVSSSTDSNTDPNSECLQMLSQLAADHLKKAFEEKDGRSHYKVFRYFGAAYHSDDKIIGTVIYIIVFLKNPLPSSFTKNIFDDAWLLIFQMIVIRTSTSTT